MTKSVNINFYLNARANKDKTYKVYCYLSERNFKVGFPTKFSIAKKSWNLSKQRMISSYSEAGTINSYLTTLQNEIQQQHANLLVLNPLESYIDRLNKLKSIVNPKNPNEIEAKSVCELYVKFLHYQKNTGIAKNKPCKESTLKVYKAFGNKLENFEKLRKKKLNPNDFFTKEFQSEFLNYLRVVLGNSEYTIQRQIKLLKTYIHYLFQIKEVSKKFERDDFVLESVEPNRKLRALSDKEIHLLESIELSNNLNIVRNSYLIGIYTGQRFSDLSKMKFKDIIEIAGDFNWHLTTTKTSEKKEIYLSAKAMNIIRNYQTQGFDKLPCLSNQKSNVHLRTICTLAGIERSENVTFHTSRATFISRSLRLGIPLDTIKDQTHKDRSTIERYISIDNSERNESIKKVWQ